VKTSLLARAFAFAVASSLFAACGGGGGGSTTSAIPQTPTGGGQNTVPGSLQDFSWGASLLQNAHQIGPAQFNQMSVDVMVNPQNAQGLLQYAQEVANPGSGLYRHFLTPEQIGQQFGASQNDVTAAEAYFQKYNLGVGTWPQHLLMVVTGKQADLEAAFGTKFGVFQGQGGNQFIAPESAPHFAQVVPIAAVVGLVNEHLNRTFFLRPGNGSYFGEHPAQIARAFDYTGAYSKSFTGAGINIGIIGTGGISPADYPAFAAATGAKMAPITLVPAVAQTPSAQNNNTGTGAFDDPTGLSTPPAVTAPCSGGSATFPTASCNPEDGEAQLDTEQAASLAPGANVLFYLAFNHNDCLGGGCPPGAIGLQGLYLTDDEIQQAIADNTADVITMSYGLGDPDALGYYFNSSGVGVGPLEFAALAAEGIAAFASSGDNGAYNCATLNAQNQAVPTAQMCANYPATDPSVVAIGGVNYPMDNAGNLVAGQQITAWASNTTASGDGFFDNSAGSGGGPSGTFAAPPWQAAIPAITAMTGGLRGTPDISMLADPNTGPFLLMNGGFAGFEVQGASGGTSAASPEFAAAWALVLQACKQNAACAAGGTGPHPYRLGNPAGLLYKIYAANGSYAAPSAFYDITAGSNSVNNQGTIQAGFSAGPGYDLVTGVGVPFVGYLINQALTAAGGTSPGAP